MIISSRPFDKGPGKIPPSPGCRSWEGHLSEVAGQDLSPLSPEMQWLGPSWTSQMRTPGPFWACHPAPQMPGCSPKAAEIIKPR